MCVALLSLFLQLSCTPARQLRSLCSCVACAPRAGKSYCTVTSLLFLGPAKIWFTSAGLPLHYSISQGAVTRRPHKMGVNGNSPSLQKLASAAAMASNMSKRSLEMSQQYTTRERDKSYIKSQMSFAIPKVCAPGPCASLHARGCRACCTKMPFERGLHRPVLGLTLFRQKHVYVAHVSVHKT
jgi:hypothetical protein